MNWVQQKQQKTDRRRFFSEHGAFTTRILAFAIALCMMLLLSGNACAGSFRLTAAFEQVLPLSDGAVAVLYTDGTVRVAGNNRLSRVAANWNDICQLYYQSWSPFGEGPMLVGLTESGSVVTTEGNLPEWKNVEKLRFCYRGIVGITKDGSVFTCGTWENPSFLTGLTNVEDLVYSSIQDMWGCLKKDGRVFYVGDGFDSGQVQWTNVRELRDSGHAFYVIKNDGTVEGELEATYSGLRNAAKVVSYSDFLFGISGNGKLLTHNGGNIYTNFGSMMVDKPGSPYYAGEVSISRFTQVKDIVPLRGLILLNKDGTVQAIGETEWDLREWKQINQVCGYYDSSMQTAMLYGIRKDGTVIANEFRYSDGRQSVNSQYRGWKLQDMYVGWGGVIGLTTDGKLVGDGAYQNVDFSIFN